VAKQDCDTFTQELDLEAPKRGRGRPRLDNPLTPAERAKAYRERKRAAKARAARLKAQGITGMYRGPNGETWTGRGLSPKWLQQQIRDGIDKESFYVPFFVTL
jgi:DNA-binding protein H-NS